MIRPIFILTILTALIVISQGSADDFVSLLLDDTEQNLNITCLCQNEKCDSNNRTCRLTKPDHSCYQSWTKELNDDTIHMTAGCMLNDFFFTQILCNGNQTDHYIICCSDKDYCNDRDADSAGIRKKLLSSKRKLNKVVLVSIIIVSIIAVSLSLIVFILCRNKQKRKDSSNYNKDVERNKTSSLFKYFFPQSKRIVSDVERNLSDNMSTDSDELAAPILAPLTFAKEVILGEKIGSGAYGDVYRCKWRGDVVAVKVCLSSEEPTWFREVDIYQTLCLSHENILRYIAADTIDRLGRIELWLATEYHENGSVYDYLTTHTITIPIMLKMMLSIASGLCHLHLPIDSTNGKVALAHRDLKTRNILVKKDLSCCIADLGLAVREVRYPKSRNDIPVNNNDNEERVVIDVKPKHRVGTCRYMAPEILDKTLNDQSFESYKAADIYALGLVYWEILRRCQTTPNENDADVYKFPYEDILPHNPGFEEMYEAVCISQARPLPSTRWEKQPILNYIFGLCQELWIKNPACRPSSLYVKIQLKTQSELVNDELSNINIESRIQGPRTA